MVPTIDGKLHHFSNVGLYNGIFVMQDAETKTLWNHITGDAMYGPLLGRSVGPARNLLQMNVKQALATDSKMGIAISNRIYFVGDRHFGSADPPGRGISPSRLSGPNPNAQMTDRFVQTLGAEDSRRPRMELGLGVWIGATHKYYPMERIRERGHAFIDQLEGRKLLIYIDPGTNTPAALFVNSSEATIKDNEIRLDHGAFVRDGVMFKGGKRQKEERPQQVFTRWYGFALTFPDCEVFGQ